MGFFKEEQVESCGVKSWSVTKESMNPGLFDSPLTGLNILTKLSAGKRRERVEMKERNRESGGQG